MSSATNASNHDSPTTPIATRSGVPASDERLQVLRLLENDEITADEAGLLLDALDAGPAADRQPRTSGPAESGTVGIDPEKRNGGKRRPPQLRIRITDVRSGAARVNLAIPLGFLDAGYRLARRVAPGRLPAVEDLHEAVRTGFEGHLIDVVDDAERVEILVE